MQGNFAPVKEIGEIQEILDIAGEILADFPEGVYIRNGKPSILPSYSLKYQGHGAESDILHRLSNAGSNPLFGALHSSKSIFGKSHDIWVEGEGMLHGLYFTKSSDNTWKISYTNRYVQSDTYRLEKELKKPCFIPSTDGDLPAVLIAAALNIVITPYILSLLTSVNRSFFCSDSYGMLNIYTANVRKGFQEH
jgi:hypothetical protein